MLKALILLAILSFSPAWSEVPLLYRQIAEHSGVDAEQLYTRALDNAGIKNAYGHRYPWAWSVTIDETFYQFKDRAELFRFLRSSNAEPHRLTYGIARLPYEPAQSPQQLWRSLAVSYQLHVIGQRLKNVSTHKSRIAKSKAIPRTQTTSPKRIQRIVARVSREVGVEDALLYAVISQESAYRAKAVSPVGAKGLMQLMPATAKDLGLKPHEMFDPYKNVHAGARYLKAQLAEFGRLDLALAAYNAGPNAVKRHNGIPPYKETQRYVPAVLKSYRAYQRRRHRGS